MGTRHTYSPARSLKRAVTVTFDTPATLLKEAPHSVRLNRQERSDLTAFAVIVAALLLLVCSWFLTPPAAAAQEQTATAVTLPTEEPADLESAPSDIRGLTVGDLLRDAWTAQGALPAVEIPAPLTMVPEYVASHDGAAPNFPADYYSVPSTEFPGVTHVFQATAAHAA